MYTVGDVAANLNLANLNLAPTPVTAASLANVANLNLGKHQQRERGESQANGFFLCGGNQAGWQRGGEVRYEISIRARFDCAYLPFVVLRTTQLPPGSSSGRILLSCTTPSLPCSSLFPRFLSLTLALVSVPHSVIFSLSFPLLPSLFSLSSPSRFSLSSLSLTLSLAHSLAHSLSSFFCGLPSFLATNIQCAENYWGQRMCWLPSLP